MSFSVHAAAARIRRAAGWCFAVEERLADVVFLGGGTIILTLAAAAWGMASVLSLSEMQTRSLWLLFAALLAAWLFALAAFQHKGWLKIFGPLLYYDLVCIARRSRYLLLRFLYAVLLGAVLCWLYLMLRIERRSGPLDSREMASFAESFFYTFVFVQFCVVALLTPAYTAGAIAEEKERRTIEFVLATDLRNREIVLSKLVSRLLNLSLLVLTGLPILGFLQFLGGVDPNLVLASFAATGLTMLSLACLSMVNSVLTRKARDAIALTYLAAVGYLALSGASWALLNATWNLSHWPGDDSPVHLEDAVHVFSAGNPVALIVVLMNELERGKHIADILPGLLWSYTLFHGIFAALCAGWAILRLRAIALKQAQGDAPKKTGRRFWVRPRVGPRPMLWKEVFAERGLRLHMLTRVFVGVLIIASFVPVAFIVAEYLGELGQARGVRVAGSIEELARNMNAWVRIVGTTVACLMLLGVAARAAGSVSGERDRQTLDALLTSPLEVNGILLAKWLGNILTVRKGWLWLGAIYGLGLITGGLHPAALPLLLVAWFIYAGVVSAMGIWFSIVSRTTLRATIWTIFATAGAAVGHWLLWICCVPLLMAAGSEPAFLRWVISFQAGMTPPAVLGYAFCFSLEDVYGKPFHAQDLGEAFGFAVLGLILWGAIAALIYAASSHRFAEMTGRLGFARNRVPLKAAPAGAARLSETPLHDAGAGNCSTAITAREDLS
jgi:ABC-type transport system involved in multi-copper enzyme maturation permease subunit